MHFFGYLDGTAWTHPCREHRETLDLGREVEAGLKTVTDTGVTGVCVIPKFLPYFDVVDQFLIEVFHPLIEDYPLTFWKAVFIDYK